MKKIQILFFTLLVCLFAVDLYAQEQGKISGKVLSTLNIPVEGAVVSVTGSEDVTTDKNGVFQIECKSLRKANISVWAAGYYTVLQAVDNRKEMTIIMIPESEYKYAKTRSHTDGFQRNNAKCLDEKGISRFVPHSSI